jgi:hypothetical protein
MNDDLFWSGGGSGVTNNVSSRTNNGGGNSADIGDLMGDPFASILGKSAPTTGSIRNNMGSVPPGSGGGYTNFASSQPLLQVNK